MLDQCCPWRDQLGAHVVLLTEQHPSMLERALRDLGSVHTLPLDQITSESSIVSALQKFYSSRGSDF